VLQQKFLNYEWPGNIRELENMIKRIVILQDETLVLREMERNPRAALAMAGAGVGGGGNGRQIPSAPIDDADDLETETADEPSQPEVAVATAPAGSKLADIAKSAAMKAERTIIEDTLHQVHWNRRRAAEQLGVSYKTLLNKIKECGISRA
jgi:two-component system response regulator AtoC